MTRNMLCQLVGLCCNCLEAQMNVRAFYGEYAYAAK